MQKTLVINADDFGLSEGVNKAVYEAHTKGVLTSATIMANMPAAEQAVKVAAELPDLGVGVHLNVFEGGPVSPDRSVECLIDGSGRFAYSPAQLAILAAARRRVRIAIRTEFAAQIAWAVESNVSPTHLDSHKHFHCLPWLFPTVCDLARRFGIGAVRFCLEPHCVCQVPWPLSTRADRKRARLIGMMSRINRRQNRRFLKSQALLGVSHTGRIDVTFLKAVSLYNPAAAAEVMTHPAVGNDDLDPGRTRLLKQRTAELEALCDPRAGRFFKDAKVRLVHYGRL
jgi:predicted glycoside hydrolase/deacetylase ChbG (UPF0249 family)